MTAGAKIPPIFRWPTPWLWGGILGIVVLSADGVAEALGGVVLTMVVAGAVYALGTRDASTGGGLVLGGDGGTRADAAVEDRLMEIERRLTDTQDVMIALSEKMDRWEAAERESSGRAAPGPGTGAREEELT